MTFARPFVRSLIITAALLAPAPSVAQQPVSTTPATPPNSTPGTPAAAVAPDATAVAQQPQPEVSTRKTMTAVRLDAGESIALDGVFDEPVWRRAEPAADFVQIDPANGRPATEKTEVRVVFTGDALYIGVTAFDSEPDRWLGYNLRRDQGLGSDDRFMWTIDTFLDGRTGYYFEMNPSGLMADSLMGINGDNRQWDGIWDARARRSDIGWTLEIEIPFRTLNFNPNSDTWGINFQRTVRRKNEETIWTGHARNQGVRRMNNAGLINGITEVSQGRGLDIKPYGLFTSGASPGRGQSSMDSDASAGLDLFYNPTPLLRANFTINTDFAQTEVDQRQVNLTRYSLFFPERREFFLDGATFLDFGSSGNDRRGGEFGGGGGGQTDSQLILPFFSRRIGLNDDGAPQKIEYGTKLTGQVGAQDIGLLHVRTGEEAGFAGENFTVGRVKRRLLRQSYIGALFTRRDGSGAESHTAGADLSLATSEFLGSENLEFNSWFLHASQAGIRGGNNAFGATIDYPNDVWAARIEATEVQESFDPSIGYVRRNNYRRYAPTVEFAPRPSNNPYIRQFTFASNIEILTDLKNELLTRTVDLRLIQVNLHSQDNVAFSMTSRRERLDEEFEIHDGIVLPLGAVYDFTRFRLYAQTANRRMVSMNTRIEVGDFYSGTRREHQVNLSLRMRPGMFLNVQGQWNKVDLPEGSFTTKLYRFISETQFSPFIGVVNNVQYDTQSAVLGWQSRFRWILTPGNDLYVVYTHNWLDDPLLDRYATLDRQFASKVLYTYRF